MKKGYRKFLSGLLTLAMLLTMLPAALAAEGDTGVPSASSVDTTIVDTTDAGILDASQDTPDDEISGEPDGEVVGGPSVPTEEDGIRWDFNNGVLTISGNGAMEDFTWSVNDDLWEFTDAPWFDFRDEITQIVIEDGVTSVGENAFAGCVNVDAGHIIVADSVEEIGEGAFDDRIMEAWGIVPSLTSDDENIPASAPSEVVRYSILALDISGSMSGEPLRVQKAAAIKFCDAVLKANGTNYVAVLTFGSSVRMVSNFTDDMDALISLINGIGTYGSTDTNGALTKAGEMLESVPEGAIKNIVLCSDGLPNTTRSYDGPFTSSDSYSYYSYANAVCNTADKLMRNCYIYTLGFFHSLRGSNLEFARKFMKRAQNAGYYDVTDLDGLDFAFGDIADDINTGNKTLKEIEFTYQSGRDYTAKCYYTDAYFAESSYAYKGSLATMSLSLAMSAFGSGDEPDYANKSKNAKDLLMEIGCAEDSIQVNDWFTVKPTTDSIGAIYGNKGIEADGKKYTLIVVAVRGGGYEQEWASNFTIGLTGQHDGFNEAKNTVLNYLIQYISDQNITGDIKLWITGYSRAAATSNLLAGEIVRNADLGGAILGNAVQYEKKDVFAYCFETPAGALTSNVANNSIYYNIFNIINSSDPVPYVAPAVMGFGRYGRDRYLPSKEADPTNYGDKLSDMLDVYKNLDSTGDYVVDNFQMKKIQAKNWLPGGKKISFVQDDTKNNFSQGVFLSNYVTYLGRDFIKNRPNYVANYQDEIREVLSVMFGCTDEQQKKLMDSLVGQAKDEWGSLLCSYIWNTGINPWGSEDDALQIVSNWLKKAVKDAGITDYNDAVINSAGIRLADLLLALIANHPNYATTLGYNISGIGAAHYPELCYSWLASMDPNYKPGAVEAFNNGSYRIIRINCDVDAQIFNKDNTLVASITNESPDNVSSIISGINEDGEKFFVLPVTEDYGIEIKARNNTTVNYGIDEYSALSGDFTRAVDYFDVALNEGESLSGTIPQYTTAEVENDTPNGSTVNYTLTMPDGTELKPDADLDGSEVGAAYSNISAVSENTAYGVVTGSGLRQNGNFAQVEAAANNGYSFVGWYAEGSLVSSDSVYRFRVSEDVTLTARFSPIYNPNPNPGYVDSTSGGSSYTPTTYRIEVEHVKNGKVVSNRANASSGSTVMLTVTPDSNYALDTLNVTDSKGNELKLVDGGNGKYTFTMPSSKVTISATFVEVEAPSTDTTTPVTINYTDVPSDAYYYDAVVWAVKNGITVGTSATTFSPDAPCTRAQVVTFLWRAAGSPSPQNSSNPFADVAPDAYYYDAVQWAVEQGITVGTSATTFSPDAIVTRGQTVTFLYRAAGSPAASGSNAFGDVTSDAYYASAVQWAVSKGVTVGTSATTFGPNDNCTRAQIVTFLYRDRAN